MVTAVGVDACRGGWLAVVLRSGQPPTAVHATTLTRLAEQVPDAEGFGVDIPVGVPERGPRRADLAARELLGPRRASVFLTPVRAGLTASTHAEASAVARRLTGHGVSRQAYGLARRILEAEHWVGRSPVAVWEVHPEVSFTIMLGRPAAAPKHTWAGMRERLVALEGHDIVLGDYPEVGRLAAVHDVLDAAAVAWSVQRLLRGAGISLPDRPTSTSGRAGGWRSGREPTGSGQLRHEGLCRTRRSTSRPPRWWAGRCAGISTCPRSCWPTSPSTSSR